MQQWPLQTVLPFFTLPFWANFRLEYTDIWENMSFYFLPISEQTIVLHYIGFAVYNMSLGNTEMIVHSLSDP